eukprot:PITA_27746
MDDFTPDGDDFDLALDTLEKVLQRCITTRLYLSHEKFYMMMTEGLILGHYISAAGIQEFDITIKDQPGRENPVADFLSQMSKPVDAAAVKDQFPDEHLFVVTIKAPWPVTIAKEQDALDNPTKLPLNPQLVIKPFEHWALDFVGPINPSSNQKTYILVEIEYVTKWVEAEALPRATEDFVIHFLFQIFVQYGLPRDIITDRGPQFAGNKMPATLKNYHIQHKSTIPYHPQENGQVESTNKVIEAILTKTIASHRRDWAKILPQALCAYQTTWRNTTDYSPYQLVFGKEPIFPLELEIQILRTTQEVSLDLNEAQTNRLQQINELDEIRLLALQCTALIQQ